jgi:hypothetical protein
MTQEAGRQGGREKAVENAVVIDKIPAQAEKGKGKEIAEGLPEYKPGQDQEEEVPSRGPRHPVTRPEKLAQRSYWCFLNHSLMEKCSCTPLFLSNLKGPGEKGFFSL